MFIKLSLEEAEKQHPILVKELTEELKSSSKKGKFEFCYSYGITIGGSLHLSKSEDIKEIKLFEETEGIDFNKPVDKQVMKTTVKARLETIIGLSLMISSGRTKRYKTLSNKPVLFIQKITEQVIDDLEKAKKEMLRISKLSDEEKAQEAQELLNSLCGGKGFYQIKDGEIIETVPQKIKYNVDDILDKISRVGIEGITKLEKKFLEEQAKINETGFDISSYKQKKS